MLSARGMPEGPVISPRQIEAQLLQHPHVKEAMVFAPEGEVGKTPLSAYVAADLTRLKALGREETRCLDTQIVDRWKKLYELTYSAGPAAPSFVGWSSSYTRQPIPEVQMREWLQGSLERIRALKPQKVLEIGCGVGLVLQHLAPQCAAYVGTDFSAAGLAQLGRWIAQRKDLQHVELLQRSATELQDFGAGSFDTVVLNSVVQYFPDVEYLLAVLREAARVVGPEGNIFLGDVRHLGLLPTFHSAVQLSRAADSVSVWELRRRALRAVGQETELAIDPRFFAALPGFISNIGAADVQLRRGRAENELTRYRYDAVLRGSGHIHGHVATPSLNWRTAIGTGANAEAAIKARRWCAVRLDSIPNQRLARDTAARQLIAESDGNLSADTLRRTLDNEEFDGVDPENFWQWGGACDYEVSVGWGPRESPERFEVLLVDRLRADPAAFVMPPRAHRGLWSEFANDPLENGTGQRLILQLREFLQERLPGSQIPSSWTVVKELPRAPDGTVNLQAL